MFFSLQDEIDNLKGIGLLALLLRDKTTRKNILWATDAYEDAGSLSVDDPCSFLNHSTPGINIHNEDGNVPNKSMTLARNKYKVTRIQNKADKI